LITTLSRVDASKGHRYAYRFSVRRLSTVEPCSGDVCIEGRPSAEGTTLVARNRTYGDVTLQVDADLKNLQAQPALPQLRVLAPRSETALATLTAQTVAQGHGYALRIQYVPGDVYARHDPAALYRLPYTSGSAHRVGQSYDGAFTHQGANRFAVDFNMPLGTPILAARAGLVVDRKDDGVLGCPQARCAPDGNFVRVRHADGTLAEYAHLQHRGVAVVLGQRLAVGQLLGYSGATGYASGPHLHFAVKKPRAINAWESLPITFVSRNGAVAKPVEGETYTAVGQD
jgi:murein DD-endopeptidase MepM/ murein hydrolase activator NlpD